MYLCSISWTVILGRQISPDISLKKPVKKRSLKKVSFEFGDPDEGDAKVIFMIGYKGEKGAKRKREAQEGQWQEPHGWTTSMSLFLLRYRNYTFWYLANKYTR